MEKSQNSKNETTRDYLHRHLDISDLVKRLITKRKDQLASKYVSLLNEDTKYKKNKGYVLYEGFSWNIRF